MPTMILDEHKKVMQLRQWIEKLPFISCNFGGNETGQSADLFRLIGEGID